MQKLLAVTALALALVGCDSTLDDLGVNTDPSLAVQVSNLTVSGIADSTLNTPFVEVQDNTGRTYFASPVTSGAGLGSFVISRPNTDLYVILFDRTAAGELVFLGASDVFQGRDLTGDRALDLRTQGGEVVGHAVLDLP